MSNAFAFRPKSFGAGYAVKLPVFEGPLDLLLQLIESQALDISAVSLVAVTDSYVQTIGQLEEIEPGALADFLVVASRLLYIKSYYLLPKPRPQVEEDDEEASGDALIRQLLEYRRFKEVASHLRSREEQGLRAYVRVAPRPDLPRRLEVSGVDAQRLQAALRKVLQRLPADPPMPRVKTYAITVAEQIENVRTYLFERQRASGQRGVGFVELLSRGATRLEVVVTFLAILELVKLGELEVDQADTFGEIILLPVEQSTVAVHDSGELTDTNSENPVAG